MRHDEVRELWVQGREAKGELSIVEVGGKEIVPDEWTKHADRHKMQQYVAACSKVRRKSRHEFSPQF